jgi:hypothetical protein
MCFIPATGKARGLRAEVRTRDDLNDLARVGAPFPMEYYSPRRPTKRSWSSAAFWSVSGWPLGERKVPGRGLANYGCVTAPVVAEVNQEICQVLIGLGTPVVVVHSENYEKGGPGTIPNIEVPP